MRQTGHQLLGNVLKTTGGAALRPLQQPIGNSSIKETEHQHPHTALPAAFLPMTAQVWLIQNILI